MASGMTSKGDKMSRKYASGLFICKLKLNEEKTGCIPDVDFKVYGENYVSKGKSVNLNDPKNAGLEVLAKLDYRIAEYPGNKDVLVEKEKAEKYAGFLGSDWAKIKKDQRYLKHYSKTKADTLATYDENGIKTPYAGKDKNEVTKFTQWQDPTAEALAAEEALAEEEGVL